MKNNGRKIFFALVIAALAALPTVAMAVTSVVRK
jgi:hypothetical protein